MKSFLYILLFSFNVITVLGQQTVINEHQGHASAILDISNTTGQGFLPPRVVLSDDLTNNMSPVNNPIEGLIVYNIGTNQLKGYYIWNDGIWSLMATKGNSITNAIFRQGSGTNTITFSGTTFQTIDFITNDFVNTIPELSHNNGQFTVPAGSYVLHLVMNINTGETTSGRINNRVHAHFYQGRLYTSSGNVLSGPIEVNESSIATSTGSSSNPNYVGARSHMISINFSFRVEETTTFSLQLARRTGGTFNGAITVRDAFVHLERSVL